MTLVPLFMGCICGALNCFADLSTYSDRLVDCTPLKRNLEAFYGSLLPKGGSPFVYLSLIIHPARVDVNVSPTKSEVSEIIIMACDCRPSSPTFFS